MYEDLLSLYFNLEKIPIAFRCLCTPLVSNQYINSSKELETLIKEPMEAGYHSVIWNADNFASGIYFVQLLSGDFMEMQKIMLVK